MEATKQHGMLSTSKEGPHSGTHCNETSPVLMPCSHRVWYFNTTEKHWRKYDHIC